jgi:hypothetical protein
VGACGGGRGAEPISRAREVAAELLRRGAGRYMAVSDGHISSGDGDR